MLFDDLVWVGLICAAKRAFLVENFELQLGEPLDDPEYTLHLINTFLRHGLIVKVDSIVSTIKVHMFRWVFFVMLERTMFWCAHFLDILFLLHLISTLACCAVS